jgi:glycosyltransferase involved in cell wall biosynthesis
MGAGADSATIRRGLVSSILDYAQLRVSVVVPTLNEAQNLPHVLPHIPAWVHEVLLVDGCSTDNTIEVAQQLRPDIVIVYQEGRGKGAALRSGFAAATGDIIVMIDADGSTNPAEIPVFVGALLSGADFVKGSRFLQGGGTSDMTLFRQVGHWGLLQSVRVLFGGNYSDLCYGYSAFWRHVLPRLDLDANGFEIETLMNVRALRANLRIAEVPSHEHERIYGMSNLRALPDGWRILKTIMREWADDKFSSAPAPVRAGAPRVEPPAQPLEREVGGPLLEREVGGPLLEREVGGA